MLMVLVPILVIVGLLRLAKRRVERARSDQTEGGQEGGSPSS
jgi:hypothetical protein